MNGLLELSRRLKQAQRDLIMKAASADSLPPDGVIRKISELENAILAVDAIIEESSPPKRR
jgi:hypothetical protein